MKKGSILLSTADQLEDFCRKTGLRLDENIAQSTHPLYQNKLEGMHEPI